MLLRTIHLVSDTCLGPVPCFLYSEANRSFSTCKHLSQASTSQFLSKTQTKKHLKKNTESHILNNVLGESAAGRWKLWIPISQFVKVPLRHCSQRFSWVHEMQSLSQASHVRPTWFTPEGYVPDRRGQRSKQDDGRSTFWVSFRAPNYMFLTCQSAAIRSRQKDPLEEKTVSIAQQKIRLVCNACIL